MSLEEIVIPELFEQLRYDVDQLGVDLHRLQRFVEVRLGPDAWRQAGDIQRLEQFVELCLRHDVTQMATDVLRLQRFVELCAAPAAPTDPAAPEPMELLSSPPGGRSRAEMEATAQDAAQTMVNRIAYAAEQGWSPASGLTWAIREMRDASQKFQCPQTMDAILKALDDMAQQHQATTEVATTEVATKEGQANG